MTSTLTTTILDGQCTGIRRELGRYTIDSTTRILFGQRIDHTTITIIDRPAVLANGQRSYRVETLPAGEGYAPILALVRDYLHQAARTHRIPASPVSDRWLDDLADSFRYDHQHENALRADTAADEASATPAGA